MLTHFLCTLSNKDTSYVRPASTGIEIRLSCQHDKGAALIVKGPTVHLHAEFVNSLEDHYISHWTEITDWIRAHYIEKIELKDLMLVTGVDLVTAWAMATFHSQKVECRFTMQGGGPSNVGNISLGGWITWSNSTSVPIRQGPTYRRGPRILEKYLDSNENQDSNEDEVMDTEMDVEREDGEEITVPRVAGRERMEAQGKSGRWVATDEVEQEEKEEDGEGINQCVFMKVYRVRKRDHFKFLKIKAEAEPQDPDYDGSDDPDNEAVESGMSDFSDIDSKSSTSIEV